MLDLFLVQEKTVNKTIVRLVTSTYQRGASTVLKKELRILKRKSQGYLLTEDVSSIGCKEFVEKITNLFSVDDGIYELVMTDILLGYEEGYHTGTMDDYSYKLVPVE